MAKKKVAKKKKLKKKKVTKQIVMRRKIAIMPKKKGMLMQHVPVKPEQLSGNYSNRALISHSQREFVFDFLLFVQESTVFVSRIITNPQHAKQIYKALGSNIKEYEKRFGEIVVK